MYLCMERGSCGAWKISQTYKICALMVTHILIIGCRIDTIPNTIIS
jgi:hypothetical protein